MPLVSLNNEEANYDTVTLLLCATNFLTFPKLSSSKRLILMLNILRFSNISKRIIEFINYYTSYRDINNFKLINFYAK